MTPGTRARRERMARDEVLQQLVQPAEEAPFALLQGDVSGLALEAGLERGRALERQLERARARAHAKVLSTRLPMRPDNTPQLDVERRLGDLAFFAAKPPATERPKGGGGGPRSWRGLLQGLAKI